jgi:hypothetical protein
MGLTITTSPRAIRSYHFNVASPCSITTCQKHAQKHHAPPHFMASARFINTHHRQAPLTMTLHHLKCPRVIEIPNPHVPSVCNLTEKNYHVTSPSGWNRQHDQMLLRVGYCRVHTHQVDHLWCMLHLWVTLRNPVVTAVPNCMYSKVRNFLSGKLLPAGCVHLSSLRL